MKSLNLTQDEMRRMFPALNIDAIHFDNPAKRHTKPKQDGKDIIRLAWLRCLGKPWPFTEEVRFHPVRRWRFDWADTERKVAVEINGLVWIGSKDEDGNERKSGRHQNATALASEYAKLNAAAELGYVVLLFSPQMVKEDPCGCAEQVCRVLEGRMAEAGFHSMIME